MVTIISYIAENHFLKYRFHIHHIKVNFLNINTKDDLI